MHEQVKLLVVGGNGFIGKHVIQHALTLGWKLTNLSLRPSTKNILPNVQYLNVDLTDRKKLKSMLAECEFDYIVNCGGYINHDAFYNGGGEIFKAHFYGLLNLLEFVDRSSLKRFVNIGSSDEYGNSASPQLESYREAPISPYSMAKAAASHFLQMLYKTEQIPTVTLRLFLTYGPGQGNERFLPQIIKGCLQGRVFPTSSGEQLRDFLYVRDTVSAIFLALDSDNVNGEVINIASGQPISIRKVIELVQDLIGYGKPQFGKVAHRKGENMCLYADISKARRLLNWKPSILIEEGLYQTIHYIKNKP